MSRLTHTHGKVEQYSVWTESAIYANQIKNGFKILSQISIFSRRWECLSLVWRKVKLVVEFVFDYVQQTVVCIVRMNENDHNWHWNKGSLNTSKYKVLTKHDNQGENRRNYNQLWMRMFSQIRRPFANLIFQALLLSELCKYFIAFHRFYHFQLSIQMLTFVYKWELFDSKIAFQTKGIFEIQMKIFPNQGCAWIQMKIFPNHGYA